MENNKARKSQIVYNGIELEVYQLPNGEYHLSKTQVGAAIEKRDASLLEWVNGKSPEALPYKGRVFMTYSIEKTSLNIKLVPFDVAYSYWLYWASKGNLKAQTLITTLGQLDYDYGIKTFGDNFKQNVVFSSKPKLKVVKSEKKLQMTINNTLNGLLEVSTPVGKIDILTDTLLIEIKKSKDWKAAIGQLLMYGHYYPKHQKILYLFNTPKNFDLDLVSYLCGEFNITVLTSIIGIKTLTKSAQNNMISLPQKQ